MRLVIDGWCPCDNEPVMYVRGGRLKLVKHRDLLDGCAVYIPGKHKVQRRPEYAFIPHYYTCPVLRRERAAWVAAQRGEQSC